MVGYEAGTFVRSLAGHDKGRVYIIVREESESVYLADGRLREIGRPKRKNKKHVQPIRRQFDQSGGWSNEAVKRAIEGYIKESKECPKVI